ncbi:MAG: DNA mismatch repair protein MutS [candidate division Zixibacteria bacterium]|nr:DNA mismatch repair protein MutS [candidate division Zixibacteria bacterium]
MKSSSTPFLNQYFQIKKNYPDQIVFFRMGDFYEMFGEDAQTASRILGIALTSRSHGKNAEKVPLAGVPYHAADRYLAKLLQAGRKVVICEQTEPVSESKKLVNREVVEIITPGTITIDNVIEQNQSNHLAAIYEEEGKAGLAYLELTTGEFKLLEADTKTILDKLKVLAPSELLIPKGGQVAPGQWSKGENGFSLSEIEPWKFDFQTSQKLLLDQLQVKSLDGFGCREYPLGVTAAGVIIDYLKLTKKSALAHINQIVVEHGRDFMFLDASTLHNLELFSTPGKPDCLFNVLNQAKTSMGARLLKVWMIRPLVDVRHINARLSAVGELVAQKDKLSDLREALGAVSDLERLTGKLGYGKAAPRNLLALKNSLMTVPGIKSPLTSLKSGMLRDIRDSFPDCSDVIDLIAGGIADDPPANLSEGGVVKKGYDADLDALRETTSGDKNWVARLQNSERERSGITSLKVGYNQVFGYYIEVTKPHLSKVPPDYIRKQTLVNAERFITQELKEREELILNAEEKILRKEQELFTDIVEGVVKNTKLIQKTAQLLSQLDVLGSLAQAALDFGYVRPELNDEDKILIEEGRHPVLDRLLPSGTLIPNDTRIDREDQLIHIITGPNMAGKSTYLRQVGLIVLMTQIGSFVPSRRAVIGVVDRIFTRVGAMDNIALGQSTFLVEMNETANILNNATPRSLILLDEVGRGTSTFDGLSIAWAVTEFIHNNPRLSARTLFATHYHELTRLAEFLPKVKNYNVAVKEWQDEIIFLHKIVPGGCDDSYGIQVAKLAGIPVEVLKRASQILFELEQGEVKVKTSASGRLEAGKYQASLFEPQPSPLETELGKIDPEKLSPLEALNKLAEWKKQFAP